MRSEKQGTVDNVEAAREKEKEQDLSLYHIEASLLNDVTKFKLDYS